MDQLETVRDGAAARPRSERLRGNRIAIALGVVAVVIAGTGTAVAVTSATTTISDATYPTRKVHVDPSGRLSTLDASSTIDIATSAFTTSTKTVDVFSSPTTATLGITKLSVVSPSTNVGKYSIYLYQVPLNTNGTCSQAIAIRPLAYAIVAPGGQAVQDFAVPLQAKAPAGKKYCLDLYAQADNASATPSGEFLNVQLAGFVVGGIYSGVGTAPAAAHAQRKASLTGGR